MKTVDSSDTPDERVEAILAANRRRPIDGDVVTANLLEIRHDLEKLIEVLHGLIVDCESQATGWLLPPVCGWLTPQGLGSAVEEARRHLNSHSDCETALEVLKHVGMRETPDAPPTLHVAFPASILDAWSTRWPLRTDQPTWMSRSDEHAQAKVGGPASTQCPRCKGPGETLLEIGSQLVDVIRTRESVEFAWCPGCSPFTQVSCGAVDTSGAASLLPPRTLVDVEPFPPLEPFPRTTVGLIDVGPEWRVQDWTWSNNVENLHRVGGRPTWIQSESVPPCERCRRSMAFVAQIAVEDLTDGEGIAYLHWCDECAITGVVYQQT